MSNSEDVEWLFSPTRLWGKYIRNLSLIDGIWFALRSFDLTPVLWSLVGYGMCDA